MGRTFELVLADSTGEVGESGEDSRSWVSADSDEIEEMDEDSEGGSTSRLEGSVPDVAVGVHGVVQTGV
jgi:hypothetical protein